MFSKIMISRNYKKKKHGVVIHLNNFASEEEKAKVIDEIKTVLHRNNYKSKNAISYKIKIGWTINSTDWKTIIIRCYKGHHSLHQ